MRAFSKLHVIDLTHVLAGPFCTYQLAILGAQVIKIESPCMPEMMRADSEGFPSGKYGLSSSFQAQSANKQSMCLDLILQSGKEILTKLIKTADILVENYRPGALAELGFNYQTISKIKAGIIYRSISGFGQQGPNSQRTARLDHGAGIQTAYTIAAALYQRRESGQGQCIDIAMLNVALMFMSADISHHETYQNLPALTDNLSDYSAGYGYYETQSEHLMLGAFTAKQVENMWIVLGGADYGKKFANCQPPAMKKTLVEDQKRIAATLKQKTAIEWKNNFNAQHVPAARVRKLDETLQDIHLDYRQILQTLKTNQGEKRLPIASFKYAHGGPNISSPLPMFAQHARDIMLELGYADDDIDKLCSQTSNRYTTGVNSPLYS